MVIHKIRIRKLAIMFVLAHHSYSTISDMALNKDFNQRPFTL